MLTVINDTHLGAQRRAGTTPASAQALTQFTEQQFIELLDGARGDLLILGDLFDTYNVPLRTVLFAFFELSRWLDMNEGFTLHLVPGNHDLSKDSSKMSSPVPGPAVREGQASRLLRQARLPARSGWDVRHPAPAQPGPV